MSLLALLIVSSVQVYGSVVGAAKYSVSPMACGASACGASVGLKFRNMAPTQNRAKSPNKYLRMVNVLFVKQNLVFRAYKTDDGGLCRRGLPEL